MPIVPIAITKPRIAIEKNALFLKGDNGCRTSLVMPPLDMNNTISLGQWHLSSFYWPAYALRSMQKIWPGLFWFQSQKVKFESLMKQPRQVPSVSKKITTTLENARR